MNHNSLSRREFLKFAGVAAGGLWLASCSGNAASSNQVRIMVDSWALSYAPFKQMAEAYNQLHPETTIKIEPSPGGWVTKVVGQIRSNKLQWSAAGVMTTFNDLAAWVQLDLIQPIDEYLAASTEPGAAAFLSDMLPPVKEDQSYDGKVYGIPFSIENITYQWNTEWFGKAGITQAPKTWQELFEYSKAVKDYLAKAGNNEVYAFGFDLGNLSRNLGALLCSISNHPFTEDGWLDWDSEEMRLSLRFMRQMSRAGLTPPDCGESADTYDLWTRGRMAGLYSCSSRGVWAQKNLGFDKITTSRLPTVDGKPHSGTAFWGNSVALLNTAPHAQNALDFLVYAVGPQNLEWQKAIIQAGTSPAFSSTYTNLIETDPALAPYRWMSSLREEIALSAPAPKNYYYQIQNESWNRHRAEYLKDSSTMTEDDLIQKILQSNRELQQQVLESVPTMQP